jgi:hypothetical protein
MKIIFALRISLHYWHILLLFNIALRKVLGNTFGETLTFKRYITYQFRQLNTSDSCELSANKSPATGEQKALICTFVCFVIEEEKTEVGGFPP